MCLIRLNRILAIPLFSFALYFSAAHAETTVCTQITTLPYVITTGGVYCFAGDLFTAMTTGRAIEIQANFVTIDLNGHRLGGASAGPASQAIGIYALDRRGVTIKNGAIRGFAVGVLLDDSTNNVQKSGVHLLENLLVDANLVTGLNVKGEGNVIQNNRVANTGGTNAITYGIYVAGPEVRIVNNEVINTTAASGSYPTYGIYAATVDGGVVGSVRNFVCKAAETFPRRRSPPLI